ncbi:MAG: 3-hydroxyacyl-ACP dehydratase FabZ [Proteobacteria bacterium]|nr:3-hydroxyacyl-ACP dehydratase FabZ [Pseudomonadota bacterium]
MLTIEQVMKILPHRYPFLLVDGVSELSSERILAFKQVTFNEPHFAGHFPGKPIMPGVLIIEALAQAGGILAHHCGGFDPQHQLLLFLGIDGAKFRRQVVPGDRLDLEVLPLRKGRIWKLRGVARVGEEVAAAAELLATVAARPE